MRILHFAPYYPPERLGGVGVWISRLHEGLVARGHDSRVITWGERSTDRVERRGRSPGQWVLASALQAPRAASVDIVHVHAGEAVLTQALLAAWPGRRARMVSTFHVSYRGMSRALAPYTLDGQRVGREWSNTLERTVKAGLHRAADRLALQLSDAVAPITEACGRELTPSWRRKGRVILHGLPPLGEEAPGPPLESVELLYVGAAGHRKRVLSLPLILERVRQAVPGARLRVVGFTADGQPGMTEALEARGLAEAVIFEGFVPPDALLPFYRSAKVLLIPSVYEGLPLVMLEAMRCGLPVVATDVCGHPEAIEHGDSGLLVPPDHPLELADAAAGLLRDPERAAAIARRGAELVTGRFGIERHIDEYEALYRELIEGRLG